MLGGDGSRGGFSTKLYRRDFPGTPASYKPTMSLTDLVSQAVDRSLSDYNSSDSIITNSLKSTLKYNNQDFMMKIALGTPPVEFFVAVNMNSDLTWTQCLPYRLPYRKRISQNHPLFNPFESSTYRKIECIFGFASCPINLKSDDCKNNVCTYAYRYNDGTETNGDLSTEILSLESTTGPPVLHTNYIFGCGLDNKGKFSNEAWGMIGFGLGSDRSFMSQLAHIIQGKFSYCLVPNLAGEYKHSTINFGHNAIVSGHGVESTRLVLNYDGPNYYLVKLHGLYIDGTRVRFRANGGGYAIIDPGSTLTRFPLRLYTSFLKTLSPRISGRRAEDPSHRFELCYELEGLVIPRVRAKFMGATIELKIDNLFIQNVPGTVCLAIVRGSMSSKVVWGNLAQVNFLVGFDTHAQTVSFKSVNCANN